MDQPELMHPAPLDQAKGTAIHANGDQHVDLETPILIVGGGPVGMLQALLLARIHGKRCILIEREATTTTFPKMEYTNGRSMEIYRAMGLNDEVRALANTQVAEHCSNNELIVTSLVPGGKLVHTWERDGPQAMRQKSKMSNDGAQYLEPHMRCHQIIIEAWLKQKVEAESLIRSYWNTAFIGLEENPTHVVAEARKRDGTMLRIKCDYLIGCDGGGSWVRKSVGLESKREYLNMTVAFAHFRSSTLRSQIPFPQFWHGNVIGGGLLVSQNERDLWTMHLILPPGLDPATLSVDDIISLGLGGCQGPVPVQYDELYCRGVWKVDVAIANGFRSASGRVFIAGDAAHQLSPVGGHGLNSGLGDVFDLSWKLSAILEGWGGERLLSSYNNERRQIAFENLQHVQDALRSYAPIITAHDKHGREMLNGDGEESRRVREALVPECEALYWLHSQNGNILGYNYKQSPVINYKNETGKRPHAGDEKYIPTTWPGSQAPHLWIKNGRSTLDELNKKGFSLVDFSQDESFSEAFVQAAGELKVPLKVLQWGQYDPIIRQVYERELVLVRPDMHVAWRSPQNLSKPLAVEEVRGILRAAVGL